MFCAAQLSARELREQPALLGIDPIQRIAAGQERIVGDAEQVNRVICGTGGKRPGKMARGRGTALALIRAAVAYATEQGAPAVEAYPRAGATRTGDDNAYFGTEPLFRRAGFQVLRKPLETRPRNWVPRVTMRIRAAD